MSYDVVVVGAGIGGLTVAALLASRGVSVCIIERQSQVGGCIGRVEFSGLNFEPGLGLYSGWGQNGIHQRIFTELGVEMPQVQPLERDVVVRLTNDLDIAIGPSDDRFFAALESHFPEDVVKATAFYKHIEQVAKDAINETFGQKRVSTFDNIKGWFMSDSNQEFAKPVTQHLQDTSQLFRRFVETQLSILGHRSIDTTSTVDASLLLSIPRQERFRIEGGPASLADSLSSVIRKNGGTVRLDTGALRLAYDSNNNAVGVELLNGETIIATKAIVSNMTVWDTYGKLIGLQRTPADLKRTLQACEVPGVYMIFASIEAVAVARLPSDLLLVASGEKEASYENGFGNFACAVSANPGTQTQTATITTETEVTEWFRFQSRQDDYEEWDQTALEGLWTKLHAAIPELGADIEVIETASPRTFYEQNRRKLGMVLGARRARFTRVKENFLTVLPNVFMVGDTISPAPTVESVSQTALHLANHLTHG